MKLTAKVIYDNGYKIELIRPIRDIPFSIGTKVELEISGDQVDLIKLFNSLIDDDTKDAILDKFSEAQKDVPVSKER